VSDTWRQQRERGSRRALQLIIWLALHLGRRACRVLLLPISAYFWLTAPQARRASQDFLKRALGHRPGPFATLQHLFTFATTLLDRVYLINGQRSELAVRVHNEQAFTEAIAAGRGCLLLGSHLGSFEMLGVVGAQDSQCVINMVMHVDDSAQIGRLLSRQANAIPYNVIPLGEPGSMLRVKECLERGEVVGILADRVYGGEPTHSASFLGQPTRFTLSPLRLARITGAPVVMVFGLFRGDQRYDIVFEPLTQRIDDAAQLTPCLEKYVAALERQTRAAPYNWFNFYDYWSAGK
jgi:predicted LPLAT superfamily acyltransferase